MEVTYDYTLPANGVVYANMDALIESNLEGNARFLSVSGFTTNSENVLVAAMIPANHNYSLILRNVGSTSITSTLIVKCLICSFV